MNGSAFSRRQKKKAADLLGRSKTFPLIVVLQRLRGLNYPLQSLTRDWMSAPVGGGCDEEFMKEVIKDDLSNLEIVKRKKAQHPQADFQKRPLSNLEIVRACGKSSRHPAWSEFYGRFDGHIRRYLVKAWRCRTLGCSKDAPLKEGTVNELSQEVYLKLLSKDRQALRSFKGKSDDSFFAYLTKIAVNVVGEHFRKRRSSKRNAQVLSIDRLSESVGGRKLMLRHLSGNPERDYLSSIAFHELSELLDESLTGATAERDKAILLLHFVDGMTALEIAAIRGIGVKASSVDSIIRRTRSRLQQALIGIAA